MKSRGFCADRSRGDPFPAAELATYHRVKRFANFPDNIAANVPSTFAFILRDRRARGKTLINHGYFQLRGF